ncbi:MAG: HTTM domain-containing protein [Rubrobacteraceae bacterium]
MNPAIGALDRFFFEKAPATRPAILRLMLGAYILFYLGKRYRMLMKVAASDPSMFKPVGVVSPIKKPIPAWTFRWLFVLTMASGVAFTLGLRHRRSGPLFAGLFLFLLSYRNSWSMIYHNDNVLVLHALILGLAPSADVLSLDSLMSATEDPEPDWRYGWPVKLMSVVTALTYCLAGIAKIKGPLGWKWAEGESLRAQIAADGMRKELLGSKSAPLAYVLYDRVPLFRLMGMGSLVLETAAPLFLVNKRLARLWAFNALMLHWGIYFTMRIKFRYQMSGLIFASFLDLDRLLSRTSGKSS